jgi:L-ascorbate metabolism protein UlaG (beta-lactamase superfamily)
MNKKTTLTAAGIVLLCSSCAALAPMGPREPAVDGMPLDEPTASFSAVWAGHATVLLRLGRRYVLTDPNLGGSLLIVPRITRASLSPRELPPLDAVVLSHMHFDHFDAKTLRKLGSRPEVLFPSGGEAYADEIAQPLKRGLAPWQHVEVAGLTITAVPARHQGGRYGIDFLWNHAFTGYLIEGAGHRVFFAGDTGYDPDLFREIGRRFPGIEVAFIPIAPSRGEEGARDRWGHVGPKGALDIFRDVGARYMVPIHFEAYFSAGERVGEPRSRLGDEVAHRHLDDRVFALRTGERFVLPEQGDQRPLVISEPEHRRMAVR